LATNAVVGLTIIGDEAIEVRFTVP